MPICENCKREIDEKTTYVYTMEHPQHGPSTKCLCPRCAKAVILAVRRVLRDKRAVTEWWEIRRQNGHMSEEWIH